MQALSGLQTRDHQDQQPARLRRQPDEGKVIHSAGKHKDGRLSHLPGHLQRTSPPAHDRILDSLHEGSAPERRGDFLRHMPFEPGMEHSGRHLTRLDNARAGHPLDKRTGKKTILPEGQLEGLFLARA